MSLSQSILLCAFVGYVCGAVPFGYIFGKLFRGLDLRQHGSGNIGATNAIRVLGKPLGIPVFILDLLKGLLPVLWAKTWASGIENLVPMVSLLAVLTGFGAVLGHMFTFWLQFKGGKGVATTGGVLLGIAPLAMLGGLVVWLITFFITRYVSLASMLSGIGVAMTLAITMYLQGHWDAFLLGFGILVMVLVIVRHRGNIQRLLQGTEPKAGAKKASS